MLTIGKHRMGSFVAYARQYPQFMDGVMRLYNDFDLEVLKDFFARFDLNEPPPAGPLTHKRYVENRAEIDRLIQDPLSYPEQTENKNYLTIEKIQEAYEGGAAIYDELWGGSWPYELRQNIVDWLELEPGHRLLEVGVGTGTNLEALPDDCHVTGIDICPRMLAVAQEKASTHAPKTVDLRIMDAARMSFEDDTFDRGLAFYTLCATQDPLQVLFEMSRVCKPSAPIVIFDVVISRIEEVAVLQYLFRPVARELGAIYLEFCPPNVITYDAFFDLFPLLDRVGIEVKQVQSSDPFGTVHLIQCTNKG
ncbi:class I SAM-dependent methyltransferase [Thermodesulfobacteriota bacterium]